MEKWQQNNARIIQSLEQRVKSGEVPEPVLRLFSLDRENAIEPDYEALGGLLLSPPDVQRSLTNTIRNWNERYYWTSGNQKKYITTHMKAFLELDTVDKIEKFMTDEILHMKDPYTLIDMRAGMWGDAFRELYDFLQSSCFEWTEHSAAPNPFERVIRLWDEAALRITLDKGKYILNYDIFKLGPDVSSLLVNSISPPLRRGEFYEQVFAAIRHEQISASTSPEEDIEHQVRLLDILANMQTPDKHVSHEYLQGLRRNPAFLRNAHALAIKAKDSDADDILVQYLHEERRKYHEDPESYHCLYESHVQDAIVNHFDNEMPVHQTYNKYNNAWRALDESAKSELCRIKSPEKFLILDNGVIVVLTGVKKEDAGTSIDYVVINSGFERRKLTNVNHSVPAPNQTPTDVVAARILARSYLTFAQKYESALLSLAAAKR